MSEAIKFEEALNAALNPSLSGLGAGQPRLGFMGVGQRFMDIIKRVLGNIDISAMTKEEFLAVVSKVYDTTIAPMLSTSPFGMIFSPLIKAMVMSWASNFYDKHSTPKVA